MQNKNTALDAISRINTILKSDLSQISEEGMINDIRRGSYKIKTYGGDLDKLAGTKSSLIKTVWKISQIDSIVGYSMRNLVGSEKQAFIRYMHNFQMQQSEMGMADHPEAMREILQIIKLEIYKQAQIKN